VLDTQLTKKTRQYFSFLKKHLPLQMCTYRYSHAMKILHAVKKARRAEMIIEPWADKIHNPEWVK